LCCRRPKAIDAVADTTGVDPFTSTTRESLLDEPPPATSIFPMSKSA
jgi:hypothetical protein